MQSNPRLINYFIHTAKPYFKDADEYIRLSKTYAKQDPMVLFDMYASPLILILTVIFTKKPPSMLSLLSLHRVFQVWIEYFRYKQLRAQFYQWNQIVNAVGGPYIATNDPTYHAYVIADGMHRTQTSIFTNRTRHRGCPNPEIRK